MLKMLVSFMKAIDNTTRGKTKSKVVGVDTSLTLNELK